MNIGHTLLRVWWFVVPQKQQWNICASSRSLWAEVTMTGEATSPPHNFMYASYGLTTITLIESRAHIHTCMQSDVNMLKTLAVLFVVPVTFVNSEDRWVQILSCCDCFATLQMFLSGWGKITLIFNHVGGCPSLPSNNMAVSLHTLATFEQKRPDSDQPLMMSAVCHLPHVVMAQPSSPKVKSNTFQTNCF